MVTVESAGAVISLRELRKSFGGVHAVSGVSFEVMPGEVVALAGENGAGKSTIKNMIGGTVSPDGGEILVAGEPAVHSVAGRSGQGIATIHQEIRLFPDLTVAENIMMGRLGLGSHWRFSPAGVLAAAQAYLDRVGATFPADRLVAELSTGEAQLVEIAKALVSEPRMIVFDEPTSSLAMSDREQVFKVVRSLRDQGVGILYISHFLDEVFSLSDRIVVMRDGNLIGTYPTRDLTRHELEALMVGRELAGGYPTVDPPATQVALRVGDLGDGERVSGVSFDVRQGEVFGLAGLMGAGRTEVARAIFGLSDRTGRVEVNGRPLRARDPRAAIAAGLAFVTEDRREEGLFLERPIIESLSVVGLSAFLRGGPLGLVDRRAERRAAAGQADQLRLSAKGGLRALAGSLSGGNQQKVVLGKWLLTEPRVLILDEPTRGIDVGAKAEIYRILTELARAGLAVVFISSEMEELIGMSHRIGVMHEGQLQGVLERDDCTPASIIRLATGGTK